MRIDRTWMMSHIPHHGRMCLLDEVVLWDSDRIACVSGSHRAADNPLRAHGRLGIACGIEYAAQALAVHGALCAAAAPAPRAGGGGARPARGFLAGLRGVEFHALRLDDVPDDLLCEANRVAGDESTALYEFIVQAGRTRLLNGRATVILQAGDGVPA
jgi:predicted hotdog family 3-hydroxylacyl-ACP dehydratase